MRRVKLHIILIALTVLASCVSATPLGWSAIQSVGGIAAGDPTSTESGWTLPVFANASGLVQVTTKPTALNSGVVCTRTTAAVQSNSVFLTVQTSLPQEGMSAQCPPAQLGPINPGQYKVYYRGPNEEPHFLREVMVGP